MNATLTRTTRAPLLLHARTAADLMVPNPISLRAEAGVAAATALFTEKSITAAPGIDQAGRAIGVVRRVDLLVQYHTQFKRFGRVGRPVLQIFHKLGARGLLCAHCVTRACPRKRRGLGVPVCFSNRIQWIGDSITGCCRRPARCCRRLTKFLPA